ncbi:GNAT family N-acetyltransferase [Actinomyces howellii]|uniref:Predicted acetyltransferase n=1 Tax=Actinomyces howellii TaxID=52771 RepID=A0A3S4R2G9_9ACTO|nr:GNAT family N-acetyltransferase [Actinomyces howellii]VEG26874.1 Predicted acetyltransferase [Actinomyces howellii]
MSSSTEPLPSGEPSAPSPAEPVQDRDPVAVGGGFVREARPEDLEAMGRLHAAAMLASLEAAHTGEHGGPGLPAGVRALVSAPVVAAGWQEAVARPPSTDHRVLVAISDEGAGQQVVGLAGLAPVHGTPPAGDQGGDQRGAELTALAVDPAHQRRGHGSRLLAAAVEHARTAGAEVLLIWVPRGDPSLAGLLTGAGLARTRSRREIPVGDGLVEELWAAEV